MLFLVLSSPDDGFLFFQFFILACLRALVIRELTCSCTSRCKDRIGKTGGGVFVAIHSTFSSTVDIELDTDCELLWAKVKVRGHKDLCIGTYYRPPGNKESLAQLEKSLSHMSSTFNGHIILVVEFNLSAIDWETHEVLPGPPNTQEGGKLLAILDDFVLHQSNSKSTGKINILDLFISNEPSIEILLGLSDHDVILAKFAINPCSKKFQRPKVNVYHKMEKDKCEEYLHSWREYFNKIKHKYTTSELWENFKSALESGVKKCVLVKTIRKKDKLTAVCK